MPKITFIEIMVMYLMWITLGMLFLNLLFVCKDISRRRLKNNTSGVYVRGLAQAMILGPLMLICLWRYFVRTVRKERKYENN